MVNETRTSSNPIATTTHGRIRYQFIPNKKKINQFRAINLGDTISLF